MSILLVVAMLLMGVATEPGHYLRCQMPDGSIVLLYYPDYDSIKQVHDACRAMGGKPKGNVR